MSSGSLYNLTWGEYGTSLISAVQLLRCHDELVDVTLAAGGRTFHAHKVVLCAASPFLFDLLKSTTCKHPVVMLAGVQASDLEALLEFVYRGEVSVDPAQLPSLLQAAHCLNIQGLSPSTITINNTNLQPNVKHEIVVEEDPQVPALATEVNEKMVKRKRRNKRSSSNLMFNKWSKVYVTETSENNISVENQDESSNSWNQQATTQVPTTGESQPLLLHSMPLSVGIAVQSRTKGASDQPGVCPLCGAMLRQARNLRRHLITSCKYRMMTNMQSGNMASTTTTQSNMNDGTQDDEQQLQQQDSQIDVQINETNNTEVDCNNLLPTTSNLLDIQ